MADRAQLMGRLDAELTQFMRENAAALQDRDSSAPYTLALMQRFRVLMSMLPMGNEKINVMLDFDCYDTLYSILEFQKKNSTMDERLKDCAASVERYVDETYLEYRRAALSNRIEKNCEDYKAGVEKLPPRKIIESAETIKTKEDIVFKILMDMDLIDIEALLTLEDPLEAIYQQWLKQESRDMKNLTKIAGDVADARRVYLDSRSGSPESVDEELYRENHLNCPDPTPMLNFMSRLNQFWDTVDSEYFDICSEEQDSAVLEKYDQVYTMLNLFPSMDPMMLEAYLTFNKPMMEVLHIAEQFGTDLNTGLKAAFGLLPQLRLGELEGYINNVSRLPNFMQESVNQFKKRIERLQRNFAQDGQPVADPEAGDEGYGEGR